MGRPRRDGSKTGRIEIRISAEEEQMLNDLSDLTGESKSDIIRKGIKMSYRIDRIEKMIEKELEIHNRKKELLRMIKLYVLIY